MSTLQEWRPIAAEDSHESRRLYPFNSWFPPWGNHVPRRQDHVAGIEARGFILGGAIAHQLSVGFISVRKKGKLPWKTIEQDYKLEYGEAIVELHEDAAKPGDKVLIVDDLLATGGTAEAAIKLIRRLEAEVVGCAFVVDLPDLGGRERLKTLNTPIHTLCSFEGE